MREKQLIFYCTPLRNKHEVGLPFLIAMVIHHSDPECQSSALWIGSYGTKFEQLATEMRRIAAECGYVVEHIAGGKVNLLRDSHGILRTADLFLQKECPFPDADLGKAKKLLLQQFYTITDAQIFPQFRSSPQTA